MHFSLYYAYIVIVTDTHLMESDLILAARTFKLCIEFTSLVRSLQWIIDRIMVTFWSRRRQQTLTSARTIHIFRNCFTSYTFTTCSTYAFTKTLLFVDTVTNFLMFDYPWKFSFSLIPPVLVSLLFATLLIISYSIMILMFVWRQGMATSIETERSWKLQPK